MEEESGRAGWKRRGKVRDEWWLVEGKVRVRWKQGMCVLPQLDVRVA